MTALGQARPVRGDAAISTSAFRELWILQCGFGLCAQWSAGCPPAVDTGAQQKDAEGAQARQKDRSTPRGSGSAAALDPNMTLEKLIPDMPTFIMSWTLKPARKPTLCMTCSQCKLLSLSGSTHIGHVS